MYVINALFTVAFSIATLLHLIHAQQDDGLGRAVASGRIGEVRNLLDSGISVNARAYGDNICGNWYLPRATALMVAASCNSSLEIARLLLDRGAVMTYTTLYDFPVLFLATMNNNGPMVQLFMDRGAPLNAAYTALMMAADGGLNNMVTLLLDRGCNPNWRDNSDRAPLHYAAKRGRTSTCRLLLDRGADINAVTIWAMTPLAWAAYNNHEDTYRFLLGRGANKRFCVFPMCSTVV